MKPQITRTAKLNTKWNNEIKSYKINKEKKNSLEYYIIIYIDSAQYVTDENDL